MPSTSHLVALQIGLTHERARLVKQGSRVVGLTVAGRYCIPARGQHVTDWETLSEREVVHPREEGAIEGSYSILMPAEGPGQLVPESAIVGPDGIEYPVAMSETAIHLSKEQVRALVGESCFETLQVPIPDNHPLWRTFRGYPAHVARWCYEQGDTRLLVVMKDGRCFDPKKWSRDYLMRDEIDALLAGTWEPESEAAYRATGRRPALPVLGEEPEPVAVECEASEAPEPIAIACPAGEAVERGDSVALDSGEGGEALSEALSGPAELSGDTGQLPEPDLAARLAEIEARLAAIEAGQGLSVESVEASVDTPIAERPPSAADMVAVPGYGDHGAARAVGYLHGRAGREAEQSMIEASHGNCYVQGFADGRAMREARPRRTAAHERAVRRAWAERRARRATAAQRDGLRERVTALEVVAHREIGERLAERRAIQAKRRRAVILAHRHWKMCLLGRSQRADIAADERRQRAKREANAILARYRGGQMVALAGLARRSQADLVQVKRTMADPTMPERSSDIARLVGERDQARNANAALEQRCARMQGAVDGCAGTIESLASRVAVAEAALRKAA